MNPIIQGQPVILQDTLPSTGGSDVAGSEVTFTAVFDGNRPIVYQWYVDYGAGAQPYAGTAVPTNTTLTLTNLQTSDTGTYSLLASNSFGPVSTTPSAFTVNSVPSPD